MSGKKYDEIIYIFSKNLKIFREDRQLTQERLSELSGVDRSYISGCESGLRNPSLDVISKLSRALRINIIDFFTGQTDNANIELNYPKVKDKYFRNVPLPPSLSQKEIKEAMDKTQKFFYLLQRSSGVNLTAIVQGNNFSGIVSNVFTKNISNVSDYKEYSEQRYPDLISKTRIGLEVKASVNAWKGGEGHNGHSGWHIIVCYRILSNGVIEIIQVELAELIGFGRDDSDWQYLGSSRNSKDSQRTETYVTTNIGTAKLRDGSLYLRTDLIPPSRAMTAHRRKLTSLPIPEFSPFFSSLI